MPAAVSSSISGEGEGIGLGEQALMHRIGRKPRGDGVGPHQFRLDRQRDPFVGQPPRGVFSRPELADTACRIGERSRDGMPAVQDAGGVAFAPRARSIPMGAIVVGPRAIPALRARL